LLKVGRALFSTFFGAYQGDSGFPTVAKQTVSRDRLWLTFQWKPHQLYGA